MCFEFRLIESKTVPLTVEFGATLMFAGNLPGRTQTIPTAIYVAMDSGNMTLAWQWVIVNPVSVSKDIATKPIIATTLIAVPK